MKTQAIIGLLGALTLTAGCNSNSHYYRPGEPYYFKHGETYQGFQPNKQITKAEADALATSGYAYTIAYFDSEGLPTNVLKIYPGKP